MLSSETNTAALVCHVPKASSNAKNTRFNSASHFIFIGKIKNSRNSKFGKSMAKAKNSDRLR